LARKNQKYCKAECRFEHFFEKRDNEKAQLAERTGALQNENTELRARVGELEALRRANTKAKETTKAKSFGFLGAHQSKGLICYQITRFKECFVAKMEITRCDSLNRPGLIGGCFV
jgi:hypothetical protein